MDLHPSTPIRHRGSKQLGRYGDSSLSHGRRYEVGFYAPSLAWRLAGEADTGGAETQLMLLTRALSAGGTAVCVVVFAVPGIEIPASDHGVDVLKRPPYFGGGSIAGRLREAAAVRSAVRRLDADVVVTRCAGFWVGLVGLSTKLSRRRFVYSSASLLDFKDDSGLRKWSDRVLFRLGITLADEIVVQTEEQVELCKRRFGRTPTLIRSVSEAAEPGDVPGEAFLWTGRIEPNKRPLEFVELARSLPAAHFWMIAPKPRTEAGLQLWAKIERAVLELPNLELLSPLPRPELMHRLTRTVAVVSTSEFEGMPNIFLEGWSRGVPALALNHDPDGVIARYGLGGFAAGHRERLVELARGLWEKRSTPDARRETGDRCRAYIEENHSPSTVSTQWLDVLRLSEGARIAPVPIGSE